MPRNDALPADFSPRFLDHMDGRTVAARELRRRLDEVHQDLGGADSLSYSVRSLVRRAIWLESWLESQEALAAEGHDIDVGKQTSALNTLLGIWKSLGLERRAKDVPSLRQYAEQRRRAQA